MTRGEQNLQAAASSFASEHGLELRTRWTSTGLEVEFVEPYRPMATRRFMRCTVGCMEVQRFSSVDMELVRVQWYAKWTR